MPRKVLIIIDVQAGFVKRQTQKTVDNIRKHLARNKYDLVIQSRWENYMGSSYERELDYTAVGNSAELEMVIKEYDDHVITRTAYSCFTDKLRRLLQPDDVIYLCGLETDACVLGTCFSLWDNNYKFHVLEDCTGTNSTELQKPTLRLMARQFGKDCVI